jgi:hypothetical protein
MDKRDKIIHDLIEEVEFDMKKLKSRLDELKKQAKKRLERDKNSSGIYTYSWNGGLNRGSLKRQIIETRYTLSRLIKAMTTDYYND